jgi:hypothetical protein
LNQQIEVKDTFLSGMIILESPFVESQDDQMNHSHLHTQKMSWLRIPPRRRRTTNGVKPDLPGGALWQFMAAFPGTQHFLLTHLQITMFESRVSIFWDCTRLGVNWSSLAIFE